MNYNELGKNFGLDLVKRLTETVKDNLDESGNSTINTSEVLTQFIRASQAFVATLSKISGIDASVMYSDYIDGFKKLVKESEKNNE